MNRNDSPHMGKSEHEQDERERHREEIRTTIEREKSILDRLADE
jgi:hypothetical protein